MRRTCQPMPLSAALAGLRTRPGWADRLARADRVDVTAEIARIDADQFAQMRAQQARNRHVAYLRRRPSRYADAAYATLTADQHRDKVGRWWDHGPRVVVLQGPSRTGKTTAAYATGNDVHGRQQWVEAWTAADLADALKPDRDAGAYTRAAGCDLLVLDDLGRERITEWWLEQLQRIVDARCADRRRLVVTTNEPVSLLRDRYGDPVVERVFDGGGLLTFDGPPIRDVIPDW